MSTPRLKTVQIAGTLLHYLEQGKGRPVIFVHGSLGDYRSWQSQIGTFSERYRAVSYSRRFAYPNDKEGNYIGNNWIDVNAADLAELIRKLDMSPAHLIGHSSGAFIALQCAYNNPGLARTLILGEPSTFQVLKNSRHEGDAQLLQAYRENAAVPAIEELKSGNDEKAVRIVLDAALGMEKVYDHLPEQTRAVLIENARILQGELESELITPFNDKVASEVNIPTLLLRGQHSPRLFHRITDLLSDSMPNVEQATIPGASHDLGRTTKSEFFNAKILEFLSRHDS